MRKLRQSRLQGVRRKEFLRLSELLRQALQDKLNILNAEMAQAAQATNCLRTLRHIYLVLARKLPFVRITRRKIFN